MDNLARKESRSNDLITKALVVLIYLTASAFLLFIAYELVKQAIWFFS